MISVFYTYPAAPLNTHSINDNDKFHKNMKLLMRNIFDYEGHCIFFSNVFQCIFFFNQNLFILDGNNAPL